MNKRQVSTRGREVAPSATRDSTPRPQCGRCKCPMNFVDGTAPEHDVKEPHWRCECWIGSGVCGRTMSVAAAGAAGA